MHGNRNEFGFPVASESSLFGEIFGFELFRKPADIQRPASKLERARQYAAEAKERNRLQCQCHTCRQAEMLPVVQRITTNWGK